MFKFLYGGVIERFVAWVQVWIPCTIIALATQRCISHAKMTSSHVIIMLCWCVHKIQQCCIPRQQYTSPLSQVGGGSRSVLSVTWTSSRGNVKEEEQIQLGVTG